LANQDYTLCGHQDFVTEGTSATLEDLNATQKRVVRKSCGRMKNDSHTKFSLPALFPASAIIN